jgi:hypothetical protein
MAAPTGIDKEIYASPIKRARARVKIRLDRPLASSNFVDEFGDASFDTTLWSSSIPVGGTLTEAGGKLTLSATATNGFPTVQSQPGLTFPNDISIGWTMEWTMDYPSITGYGVFFRVCDIENEKAIVAIKNNTADGYTIEMPDGTVIEDLGAAHTTSHDYELIYTPPTNIAAGQYELKRDTVSKGTIASTGRQAWYIAIGNKSIQTAIGTWTSIAIARVDVNLDSGESQDWPDWTDREQSGTEWWGRLPHVINISENTHERNDVDQVIITIPQGGFITGIEGDRGGKGWRSHLYGGFNWANREIRVEKQHVDGQGRATAWTEEFRGLCDEPRNIIENGRPMLEITARDKIRRQLQMVHLVKGFSDAGTEIAGLKMNKTWTEIIEDICNHCGLAGADYNVLSGAIKPRTWNILGESGLAALNEIASQGAVAVYRNTGTTNPGRLEVQEFDFGSDSPDFYVSPIQGILQLDYAETAFGMVGQVIIVVQHSEFGEFADSYPRFAVPPYAAELRKNVAIAQTAGDINSTRLLPYLHWRMENRELNSIIVRMLGQSWFENGLEAQVMDRDFLKLTDEYYVIIGWERNWNPQQGDMIGLHLANQHPDRAIRRNVLDITVQQDYST